MIILHTWFDDRTATTKYRYICNKCGHKYYACTKPKSALSAAVRKGYDLETGTCRTCRVMDSMAVLTAKRSAA
jgi:hypothetical protein